MLTKRDQWWRVCFAAFNLAGQWLGSGPVSDYYQQKRGNSSFRLLLLINSTQLWKMLLCGTLHYASQWPNWFSVLVPSLRLYSSTKIWCGIQMEILSFKIFFYFVRKTTCAHTYISVFCRLLVKNPSRETIGPVSLGFMSVQFVHI